MGRQRVFSQIPITNAIKQFLTHKETNDTFSRALIIMKLF